MSLQSPPLHANWRHLPAMHVHFCSLTNLLARVKYQNINTRPSRHLLIAVLAIPCWRPAAQQVSEAGAFVGFFFFLPPSLTLLPPSRVLKAARREQEGGKKRETEGEGRRKKDSSESLFLLPQLRSHCPQPPPPPRGLACWHAA